VTSGLAVVAVAAIAGGATAAVASTPPPIKPKPGQWIGETSQKTKDGKGYEPIGFTVTNDRKKIKKLGFIALLDCDGNIQTKKDQKEVQVLPPGTGNIKNGKFTFKWHKGQKDIFGEYPTELDLSGKFKKVTSGGHTAVLATGNFSYDTPGKPGQVCHAGGAFALTHS
jgi:hypothetical protein